MHCLRFPERGRCGTPWGRLLKSQKNLLKPFVKIKRHRENLFFALQRVGKKLMRWEKQSFSIGKWVENILDF